MSVAFTLDPKEQATLGKLACLSIAEEFAGKSVELPDIEEGILTENLGCFVTLYRNGHLRGCIGSMIGTEPLYKNVLRMAKSAAFNDHRFPKLRAEEWNDVQVEISVLGPLSPCPDVNAIEIGRHGLYLVYGKHGGVFLPKVPVEQGWNLAQYLENLCLKAGVHREAWKEESAQILWYEALVFPVDKGM